LIDNKENQVEVSTEKDTGNKISFNVKRKSEK